MTHEPGPEAHRPAPVPALLRRRVPHAVLGLGLLSAALTFSPAALLTLTGFGGLLVVVAGSTGTGERSAPGRGPWAWLRRVGLGTAALVGASGVLASAGAAALLMWVAVLGASWWFLRGGRAGQWPVGAPPVADEAVDLGRLSDRDLCRPWRSSCLQVRATNDPATLARLAQERAGYLDELERRRPRQVRAWLASAANPARYLPGDAAATSWADEHRHP